VLEEVNKPADQRLKRVDVCHGGLRHPLARTGELLYANAGHNRRCSTGENRARWSSCQKGGTVLGILEDLKLEITA
jgi:hypothetical protein